MLFYFLMKKKHIIVLGGLPGSGKSTMRKLLATRLGYKTFSTGDFVRELAIKEGHTLESFNALIAEKKDMDELIDLELKRIEAEEDEYIVDSHLAFHFVPSAFSVYLDISLETSVERIFADRNAEIRIKSGEVMETLEEARKRTEARINNHKDRYKRHYGINPYLPSEYDLSIKSEKYSPEEIGDQILEAYSTWLQN